MKDDDDLKRVINYYEESEQASIESRYLSERDRDYYDHIQWSEDELAALERRSQPAITINRIKPKVDYLKGLQRQNRTDPKAYPRTPIHDEAATAATDAIRYVRDNNEFDEISSDAFDNETIEGTCGVEVLMKKGPNGLEVALKYIPWDRLFWDQHSRRRSFDDAKFKGSVMWMDTEDAYNLAEGTDEEKEALFADSEGGYDDTYEDAPRTHWNDKERNRVKICSIWWLKNGVWYWGMFTKNGWVKAGRKSPFLDEDGMPECGLIMQSANVDRDGNRYGWVRTQIDLQDEINKRRSKSLHLLSVRQFRYEKGAIDDPQRTKDELAKPDGAIETNPNFEFEMLSTNDLAQGQLMLLQDAKLEIDNVAANPNADDGKVRSGRAEIARQQAGTMELGSLFSGHKYWEKQVYRAIWNRIKQFWDAERWIRVTDDENNLKWVGLNRPVTVGEQLQKDMAQIPPEKQQDPAFQQALAQISQDPRMNEVVSTENMIAELDVDILIEDAPNYPTAQAEQFDNLVSVLQTGSNLPLSDPRWQLIVMSSQLRNKRQILDFLKQASAPDPQQQALQGKAMELSVASEQAEIDNTRADSMKKLSEAKKIQAEIGFQG